ncbi:MAG: transglutaminase family protein [Marivibrio sp.]|uniref:transglutaminase family protein n=1 Tax=Marivibrio sp. TaxID=2039719 RepID=UPI0032EF4124
MSRLSITHVTEYRYTQPVRFGEHRLLFRPRDSHDLRLVSSGLKITPPASLRWLHDPFGNSVAIANFKEWSDRLRFESEITIDHYGLSDPEFRIEEYARTTPFVYAPEEQPDLLADMMRHTGDPQKRVAHWARSFLDENGRMDTAEGLQAMNAAIKRDFLYNRRDEHGVQTAEETLRLGSGSCRDFALLMMEAVRSLGMAARFVTGYLYDPALDGGAAAGVIGAGTTHAWCQIYLPGSGWTEFDPTNGRYGGGNLIRIGAGRTPEQVKPIEGSYFGPADAAGPMTVEVSVRRVQKAA